MDKKETARQVKVGAFVLAGVALFLISVFFIGSENNVFSRTFTVSAVFGNVDGLKPGDNVWLSGVKIGTVSEVRIVPDGHVVVDLSVKNDQNQFIETDAVASIGSDGLVGSKIVVITPGASGRAVADGDTLTTVSPADTQDIINLARDVGENTRSITADLRVIASRLNEGQGLMGELLTDGELSQEIRATVQRLHTTGNNAAAASSELRSLIAALQHGPGLLPMLISDTAYADTFERALANIEKVSTSAGAVSESLEDLTAKINSRDNALGVLLADSVVADQLKATIENAAHASHKLDENMEALQHNFLFRGYFRRQEKRRAKEAREDREEREAASSKQN